MSLLNQKRTKVSPEQGWPNSRTKFTKKTLLRAAKKAQEKILGFFFFILCQKGQIIVISYEITKKNFAGP
jgi:hypothetical protein